MRFDYSKCLFLTCVFVTPVAAWHVGFSAAVMCLILAQLTRLISAVDDMADRLVAESRLSDGASPIRVNLEDL